MSARDLTPSDRRLIVALYDERMRLVRQISKERERHELIISNLRAEASQLTLKKIGEKFDTTASVVLNIVRYHCDP